MNIQLDYSELEKLVREKAGTELHFQCQDSDTVKVNYPFKLMGRTSDVGISLRVVSLEDNDVKLSYSADGGALVNMALGTILNSYKSKFGDKASISGNEITVHLDRIPQLAAKVAQYRLDSICFNPSMAEIRLTER